jgi:aspartate racemase
MSPMGCGDTKAEKTVGILGGMGPAATGGLFARIVQYSNARVDQDHLHVIVDSNPKIPSRQEAILGVGEDPTGALCSTAQNLETAGADFIVIPCNTAHVFLSQVRNSVTIPVLSIVDETIDTILAQHPGVERVGLMGATAIVASGLYRNDLQARGIKTIVPSAGEQELLMDAIHAIKGGDQSCGTRKLIRRLAAKLVSNGAEVLILACTELALAVEAKDLDVPAIDTIEVLALAAIREARST